MKLLILFLFVSALSVSFYEETADVLLVEPELVSIVWCDDGAFNGQFEITVGEGTKFRAFVKDEDGSPVKYRLLYVTDFREEKTYVYKVLNLQNNRRYELTVVTPHQLQDFKMYAH